jgi:hypothetical protein
MSTPSVVVPPAGSDVPAGSDPALPQTTDEQVIAAQLVLDGLKAKAIAEKAELEAARIAAQPSASRMEPACDDTIAFLKGQVMSLDSRVKELEKENTHLVSPLSGDQHSARALSRSAATPFRLSLPPLSKFSGSSDSLSLADWMLRQSPRLASSRRRRVCSMQLLL